MSWPEDQDEAVSQEDDAMESDLSNSEGDGEPGGDMGFVNSVLDDVGTCLNAQPTIDSSDCMIPDLLIQDDEVKLESYYGYLVKSYYGVNPLHDRVYVIEGGLASSHFCTPSQTMNLLEHLAWRRLPAFKVNQRDLTSEVVVYKDTPYGPSYRLEPRDHLDSTYSTCISSPYNVQEYWCYPGIKLIDNAYDENLWALDDNEREERYEQQASVHNHAKLIDCVHYRDTGADVEMQLSIRSLCLRFVREPEPGSLIGVTFGWDFWKERRDLMSHLAAKNDALPPRL